MGILIERSSEVDAQVYNDAWKDIESILNNADDFSYVKAPKSSAPEQHESIKKSENKNLKQGLPQGYCIRTGKKIPFNVEKPMSYDAWSEWSLYNNPDYPEKFCHFSGEPSNGETTYAKPILKKNWKKAKEIFELI